MTSTKISLPENILLLRTPLYNTVRENGKTVLKELSVSGKKYIEELMGKLKDENLGEIFIVYPSNHPPAAETAIGILGNRELLKKHSKRLHYPEYTKSNHHLYGDLALKEVEAIFTKLENSEDIKTLIIVADEAAINAVYKKTTRTVLDEQNNKFLSKGDCVIINTKTQEEIFIQKQKF